MQRQFSTLPEEVRILWPANTPHLTLRELAWQYLEQVGASQDFCPQTRFLCNGYAAGQFGLSDGSHFGVDSYEMARLILKGFHFVGIVEEMKKSLEVLTDRLLQRGVHAYFDLHRKLNACPGSSRPAWLTWEDPVGRRVLETSHTDQLLHREFREEILQAHSDLRKHRWLGFRPAATDATELLKSGWRETARSLANSVNLYRHRRADYSREPVTSGELCSDLLELRAAKTVADRHAGVRREK